LKSFKQSSAKSASEYDLVSEVGILKLVESDDGLFLQLTANLLKCKTNKQKVTQKGHKLKSSEDNCKEIVESLFFLLGRLDSSFVMLEQNAADHHSQHGH
jgi:hypothetical protein